MCDDDREEEADDSDDEEDNSDDAARPGVECLVTNVVCIGGGGNCNVNNVRWLLSSATLCVSTVGLSSVLIGWFIGNSSILWCGSDCS